MSMMYAFLQMLFTENKSRDETISVLLMSFFCELYKITLNFLDMKILPQNRYHPSLTDSRAFQRFFTPFFIHSVGINSNCKFKDHFSFKCLLRVKWMIDDIYILIFITEWRHKKFNFLNCKLIHRKDFSFQQRRIFFVSMMIWKFV